MSEPAKVTPSASLVRIDSGRVIEVVLRLPPEDAAELANLLGDADVLFDAYDVLTDATAEAGLTDHVGNVLS